MVGGIGTFDDVDFTSVWPVRTIGPDLRCMLATICYTINGEVEV